MKWTIELEEKLLALLDDPRVLSANKIAAALGHGISRNAVIGKCNRMNRKLPLNGCGQKKPRGNFGPVMQRRILTESQRARKYASRRKRTGKAEIPPTANVAASRPACDPIPFSAAIDVRRGVCLWPVDGTGADMLVCGAARHGSTSYCAEHFARSVADRS